MFYGWYIALAGSLFTTLGAGMGFYGFTPFITPIATTFGWSYAQVALAISIRGAETGLMEPFLGLAVDRWPVRRLAFIGIFITVLGLLVLSQVTNLAMYYLGFLIMGVGGALLALVPVVTVSRWFRANVGKASALVFIGGGFSGFLLPIVVGLIDAYGWQTTLIIEAAGFAILGIPLSLVFRNRPEEHGLLPDGRSAATLAAPGSPERHDFGTGLKEALKKRVFWYYSIASILQIFGVSAAILLVMPYLASVGVEKSTATMVAMALPIASIPTRLMFGWLADIFRKSYMLALSMFLTSVSLFLFSIINAASSWGLTVLFIVFFALGLGGVLPLRAAIIRDYFGTKRFGAIYGLVSAFGAFGSVAGPPLAGWVYDVRGVYDPIWLVLSLASLVGMVIVLFLPSPPSVAPQPERDRGARAVKPGAAQEELESYR